MHGNYANTMYYPKQEIKAYLKIKNNSMDSFGSLGANNSTLPAGVMEQSKHEKQAATKIETGGSQPNSAFANYPTSFKPKGMV